VASERSLPVTWLCERTAQGEVFTFRWGRGAGAMTVQRGDARGQHHDDGLVDVVAVGGDWIDDNDVRVQARKWLRSRGVRATGS
jgi:hypothetical protein